MWLEITLREINLNQFLQSKNFDNSNKNVLSLFSGCGGMDIGFEGGFTCLKRSVNLNLHRDWIEDDLGDFVRLKKTGFKTIFANDIKPEAKSAWLSYFKNTSDLYKLDSIVNLVERAKNGEDIFPKNISILTFRILENFGQDFLWYLLICYFLSY